MPLVDLLKWSDVVFCCLNKNTVLLHKEEFEALAKKMVGDVSIDLERSKKDIRPLLENDIVTRYYFRKGALEHQLRDDKAVEAALEILADPERYKKILSPKK